MSDDDLITTAEAARILDLSERQVRDHARLGNLPARRFGRDWMFVRRDVKAFTPRERGRPAT